MNSWDIIKSDCCNCIVGLRIVGCCLYVMSIFWYLSYVCYEGMS